MSGASKRRQSKWDNKDPEAFSEDFYDRAPPRRLRETFSPDRGSRQHDSRSRENTMTSDKEGNCMSISPELDDWRPRHSSRSPRNVRGLSHRISRSRSRSRSQSPVHNFRREPAVTDRGRSRPGASGKICRDFAAGRCRRGHSCHFLHQDAQLYDSRRPLECGPLDDWEGRRRTGSSRYSPDDIKDNIMWAEKSARVCNDFLKGRCRRGDVCRFVHHDSSADVFEKGPGEDVYRDKDHERRSRDVRDTYPDREHKNRDTYPDHEHRSRDTYPDYEHRSRDTYADHDHRNRDTYADHDHRNRDTYSDHDHRRRDMYTDRNHESDPHRRGEIPCKFFASGNCRNGTRCRFSHQVQEIVSPERSSRDDKCETGHKFEGSQGWDGPGWSDVTTVSTIPTVPGWEEDKSKNKEVITVRIQDDERGVDHKFEGDRAWTDATSVPIAPGVRGWGDDINEIREVAKDVTGALPRDDSLSHDMLIKPAWDPPATSINKPQIQEKEDPVQWKTESNIPIMGLSTPTGIDILSADMEISPRDVKQQNLCNSSTSQAPSISSIAFAAVQQGTAGETFSFEKHYHTDLFAEQNASYKDNEPISYSEKRRNVVGDHSASSITQNQAIPAPQGQSFFQSEQNANIHPIPDITPRQSQMPVLSHAPQGEGMQEVSHQPSSILENTVADGPHAVGLTSFAPDPGSTAHSTVSNEQLAQLSHITASLTQLLESRQQLSQLSSSVSPHGMPNAPDLAAPVRAVSGANMGNQLLPSVEQKNSINEIHDEGNNINQQEHLRPSKDEENGKDTTGFKAPENAPSQDVGPDVGADDSKKLKDIKGIRPFKFALAEFVKDLLKPSWKDGQVSKEAYKTIVKKVVDKVMETLGPQIPQTKEKIDLYLSCSKSKIDKLVQAYVGKHQKG